MNILIVKTSSLGDIIHTFPVLEYFHEKFPKAKLDWVVEAQFAELVEAHPYVNRVYHAETRNWRKAKSLSLFGKFLNDLRKTHYDVLFDFQGNTKSALITAFSKARKKAGFGKLTVSEWPNLLATNFKADPDKRVNVRKENLFLAQSYFEDRTPYQEKGVRLNISQEQKDLITFILKDIQLKDRKKIMVCPGSAWKNKQMTTPALINFLKKIEHKYPCTFLLTWGNDREKLIAHEIQSSFSDNTMIVDKLPIPTLQNLMRHMDFVIGMDSLPLHLAGTTSTPTFSIFGASSASKYKPLGPKHHSFQGECPYGETFNRRCPILRTCSTGACIRKLAEDALFAEFESCNLFR